MNTLLIAVGKKQWIHKPKSSKPSKHDYETQRSSWKRGSLGAHLQQAGKTSRTPSVTASRLVTHPVVKKMVGNPLLQIHMRRRLHRPNPCQQVHWHTGGRRKALILEQMVGVRPLLARVVRKIAVMGSDWRWILVMKVLWDEYRNIPAFHLGDPLVLYERWSCWMGEEPVTRLSCFGCCIGFSLIPIEFAGNRREEAPRHGLQGLEATNSPRLAQSVSLKRFAIEWKA